MLEAGVSRHMTLTRFSIPHSRIIETAALLVASPYHPEALSRQEAAPHANLIPRLRQPAHCLQYLVTSCHPNVQLEVRTVRKWLFQPERYVDETLVLLF